jgi:hypothetical protein
VEKQRQKQILGCAKDDRKKNKSECESKGKAGYRRQCAEVLMRSGVDFGAG